MRCSIPAYWLSWQLFSCLAVSVLFCSTGAHGQSANGKISKKEDLQLRFCMQFEQAQDTVDVETLLEDMEALSGKYGENAYAFWTTPSCHAPRKNDTEVPIIFNTASDPVRSENFPRTVHDYMVEERKDRTTWLRAINTTTSDGYSFLDYLQYNIERGNYSLKRTQDAVNKIIAYICLHGGTYSKYKNTVKCPAQP